MQLFRHNYSSLQAYARQQSVIAGLGQRAIAGEALQSLMESAAESVAERLGVEYSKVLELLPDGKAFLLRAGVGWRTGLVGRATVEAQANSQAGYTLLSKTPVIVEDFGREKCFHIPTLLAEHAGGSVAKLVEK